jgi:hypothetical protein
VAVAVIVIIAAEAARLSIAPVRAGKALRDVAGRTSGSIANTKKRFGLSMPSGCVVSVTVPRKSLSFAMNNVGFSVPPTRTSGPHARLSIFAGMSSGLKPYCVS